MGDYVPLRYAPRRPFRRPGRTTATGPPVRTRSHAAILPAVVLLGVGLWLGTMTVIAPVMLGVSMMGAALSFLGSRLNPLSMGFYLNTKPSWSAIGVLFLSAGLLLYSAYLYYVNHWGPLFPFHFPVP
jgi:hypothetical protein